MSALAAKNLIRDTQNPLSTAAKKTRILIVADNPMASRDVATSLRAIGLDVMLCLFDGRTLSSTPVKCPDAILCHLTDYVEMAPKIAKVVRSHYAPRKLPVIGALSRPISNLTSVFDSTLFAPMHPTQIANRVGSMIRLGRMEAEIVRRVSTLREDFGESVDLGDMSPNRAFRVLFIGKASPSFMVVINALQEKGVEVVAAFTSFSAFDYLHGDPFDAVVMNALEQSEPALTISETMRKNAQLYHVPTLFLVDEAVFQDRDAAYRRGARDIISKDSDPEEIRGRILELANYHRIHEQLKREMFDALPELCRDRTGTVFSKTFFELHLKRVLSDATSADHHVTLIGLKIIPTSPGEQSDEAIGAATTQAGSMIKDMVRLQDIVCRYDDDRFVIAFYDTDEAVAHSILDRLRSIVETFSFATNPIQGAALTLNFDASIVQAKPQQDPSALIMTVMTELA